jgi:hypothetical protein
MAIRVRTRHLGIVLCVMLQSLAANPSRAAEWSMEPSVDVRTEYNDNIQFTSAAHPSIWGIRFSPDVKFSGTTESLNVTGGLRFNLNRYFGESGLDTNDHILTLRSSYKTERDLLGLNVDSVRDSTLVSELSETGVVQARRQRSRLTANPTWSRYLTEATAITASYRYSDVRYADSAGTSLIDYRDQAATVGLQSKLSERDVASVTGYYDRYETEPAQVRANTYGIQAAYDRAFSETLHGFLAVGARETRSTVTSQALVCDGPIFFGFCLGNLIVLTSTQSATSTGYTLTASLDKRWETAQVTGRLSREINPSGVGALVQTDRAGVTWTQQWSPTLSYSVEGAVYRSRYVGDVVTGSNSQYYTIEPRVSWKITEWWTLSGGYSYSHVKYEAAATQATRNVVYLVLNYTWPKLSVSR